MRCFFIFISLLCFSCSEKQSKESLITLKIDGSKIVPDIDYSEFVEDSVRLVCLEGGDGKMIGEITNLRIIGDTIYILDEISQSIFRYHIGGKFISKLSAKGRAGNEYIELWSNCIYIKDMNLSIVDKFGGKILVYDKDNKFIRSIPLKYENGDQIFVDYLMVNEDGFSLICNVSSETHFIAIDEKGKIRLRNIPLPEFKKRETWKYGSAHDLICFSEDEVHVNFYGVDTIYNVANEIISPKYVADFGEYKVSEDLLNNSENLFKDAAEKTIGIEKMAFLGKYILLFFKVNKVFYVSIYSRDGKLLGGPCEKFIYKDSLNFIELNTPIFTDNYSVDIIKPVYFKNFAKFYPKELVKYKNGGDYLDYFKCAMETYDVNTGNPMLLIQKWKK